MDARNNSDRNQQNFGVHRAIVFQPHTAQAPFCTFQACRRSGQYDCQPEPLKISLQQLRGAEVQLATQQPLAPFKYGDGQAELTEGERGLSR